MTVGEIQPRERILDLDRIATTLFEDEKQKAEHSPLKRPVATYRLQLHSQFRFEDADRIVDYLSDLGISDVYLSPYLAAREGSTHGYDVINHRKVNPELGGKADHQGFLAHLERLGMGRVLDIVPNHTGFSITNPMILDVLENGPEGRFASFFDIDWNPGKRVLEGRILLPILEDFYGNILNAGSLKLEREGGQFWVLFNSLKLPLRPRSYGTVMKLRAEEFVGSFRATDPDVQEYMSIIQGCRFFPSRWSGSNEEVADLRRETSVMKRRIETLCETSPRLRDFLDENLRSYDGVAGDPESFDALHRLLEDQVYRLAYWRVASEEINYRRFFDVTDLAGIRVEDPEVFEYVHRLIFDEVSAGGVTALRIDHPDGLADPVGYFERLQEQLLLATLAPKLAELVEDSEDRRQVEERLVAKFQALRMAEPDSAMLKRFPVVAEKILSSGEKLPLEWPIDGTVGYKYLNLLNGLFVNAEACKAVESAYRDFTGDLVSPQDALRISKVQVARSLLSSELNNLAQLLSQVAETSRQSRDFTLNDLRRVLVEVVAGFRVYRTYFRLGSELSTWERDVIDQAIHKAKRRLATVNPTVFSFVRDVLQFNVPLDVTLKDRAIWVHFITRFQQTTGPLQAKGLEDTTFYRQVSLVSLNEVGGDPSRFGVSLSAFHKFNINKLAGWPGGFLATATHDTKRGEDARIRINVISELIEEWTLRINRWSRWNDRKKINVNDVSCPDASEQYLFYQTLIGAWPFEETDGPVAPEFVERIQGYMEKAVSEAKRNTNWTDPDPSYKKALSQYVSDVLGGDDNAPFLNDFLPFQRRIARIAMNHSLSQALVKVGSAGVADVFQGCERWDFSLVDPDNRRPIDYEISRKQLALFNDELDRGTTRAELAERLYAHPYDGAIKHYVLWTALNHRKSNPDLYLKGTYRGLETQGTFKDKVIALSRHHETETVLIIASRLVGSLMGQEADTPPIGLSVWGDTALNLADSSPSTWKNLLTGEILEASASDKGKQLVVGELFRTLPIALLVAV